MADTNNGYEYVNVNVSALTVPQNDGYEYINTNVSLFISKSYDAYEYVNFESNNDAPYPTVLGVRPTKARTGDSVTVIATGAGSTKPTYLGALQVQNDDGSWSEIPTTRWQQIAATSDAYNSFRTITDDMETVDVEHVEIDIVVPNSATPPNLPIRIVTNTP